MRRNLRVEQFACVLRAPRFPRRIPVLCRGTLCAGTPPFRAASAALPQGPSLGSGFFCPGPSTLNRPHPPHSQAHPDFTAVRLIPDAFAVHTAPRRPPSGSTLSLSFLPNMPPSTTPGRSETGWFQSCGPDIGLRHVMSGSALPTVETSTKESNRQVAWRPTGSAIKSCEIFATEVGRHNRKIVDKIEKLGSIATLPLSARDTSPTHPRIPALDAKMHPATAPQPESRSFATAAPHSRLSPPQN